MAASAVMQLRGNTPDLGLCLDAAALVVERGGSVGITHERNPSALCTTGIDVFCDASEVETIRNIVRERTGLQLC